MADQFIGEIRMFGGNFAPAGWALCNGQVLSISQNSALFSLLGTMYGGDGRSNFALPNLQGRIPLNAGQGSGSNYAQGDVGGSEGVTLVPDQLPQHSHAALGLGANANLTSPAGGALGQVTNLYHPPDEAAAAFHSLATSGGGQPHNNLQPYLVVNFIIALQGIFPARG